MSGKLNERQMKPDNNSRELTVVAVILELLKNKRSSASCTTKATQPF